MLTTRNKRAIRQYSETHGLEHQTEEVFEALGQLLPILGAQSQTRQMINRIGCLLLHENVSIVAPSCPDYSHKGGIYTFGEVGEGVPLLAQLHIKLLAKISNILPNVRCELVVADQESQDAALCDKVALTQRQFLSRIETSVKKTADFIGDSCFVSKMTERFPDLLDLEEKFSGLLRSDETMSRRIRNDTKARSAMYRNIGVYDELEMYNRTVRTAAQYCALAHIAARDRLLVCNHETVNLTWYNQQKAAVLHNAVSIY